jgi:gas vesicle protein
MNDIVSQLKSVKNDLGDVLPPEFIDRMLETMGLQVRRSAFTGFLSGTGIFLAGVVCGGAAALLLAPKAGLEMRSDLEDKVDTLIEKVKAMVPGLSTEGETTGSNTGTSASSSSSSTGAKSDKSKEGNASQGARTPGSTIHHS